MRCVFADYLQMESGEFITVLVVWDNGVQAWKYFTAEKELPPTAVLANLREAYPNFRILGHKNIFLDNEAAGDVIAIPAVYNPARILLATYLAIFNYTNGCRIAENNFPNLLVLDGRERSIFSVNLRNLTCNCQPYSKSFKEDWCRHILFALLEIGEAGLRRIVDTIISEFLSVYGGE